MHGLIVTCCFVTGFTYLDPPPPEQEQILIDFTELEPVVPEQIWNGTQPKVAEPDPSEPIKLVQASEGPNEGTESNEAPESTVDDFGDVDIVEKPREKEINRGHSSLPRTTIPRRTLSRHRLPTKRATS